MHRKTKLQLCCADVYLEVSESDVPVSGRVSVGAGHEQSVIFVQAADVLAMVGGGGGGVDLAGVERGLLGPVVVDVHTVQREPVLTGRLIKGVGHLKPGRRDGTARFSSASKTASGEKVQTLPDVEASQVFDVTEP